VKTLLFDTLRLSRSLREKGYFTPEQAEVLAEALGEAGHHDLATKRIWRPLSPNSKPILPK
jgi:hypothetical protein